VNTANNAGYCHVEGSNNVAMNSVQYAHVEGKDNIVTSPYSCSHIEGVGHDTTSHGGNYPIHVGGQYSSIINGNYLEFIGNGTNVSDVITRSNARVLDFDGNETLAGKLTIGVAPANSMDVTTKGIVDGYIADAYSSSLTYNVGDYVIYNNILYVCSTAITVAEAWNSAHWTATKVTEMSGGGGGGGSADLSIVAPTYNSASTYSTYDYCIYNDNLYRCIAVSTTGSFTPADWTQVTIGGDLNSLRSDISTNATNIANTISLLAPSYNGSNTYNVGDIVIYSSGLYRCNSANTTGVWDSSKWTAITVSEMFVNANNVAY